MTIPEAARLVIQAGLLGNGGEVFVLDMGEPIRIADLAHDMVRLSNLEVGRDIEIRYTDCGRVKSFMKNFSPSMKNFWTQPTRKFIQLK